jgi:hypothetical protein
MYIMYQAGLAQSGSRNGYEVKLSLYTDYRALASL